MSERTARTVGTVAVVGAAAQLTYGVLAIMFPWPAIAGAGGETVWIAANIGMIAGLAGWAGVVARGRTVVVGAAVAGVGFAVRIAAAVVTIASPEAEVLPMVLASIALTLGGVLTVAIGTFLVSSPQSVTTWVPLVAFIVELGVASMYSVSTQLHFVLLGLAWGAVWMVLALVVRTGARPRIVSARRPAPTT